MKQNRKKFITFSMALLREDERKKGNCPMPLSNFSRIRDDHENFIMEISEIQAILSKIGYLKTFFHFYGYCVRCYR